MDKKENKTLNAKDLWEVIRNISSTATIEIGEVKNGGCWKTATHDHYYISVGGEKLSDEGKHNTPYGCALTLLDLLKKIVAKLAANGYCFAWEDTWLESGGRDCFNIPHTKKLAFPVRVMKVNVTGGFRKVQKWLKNKAGYTLEVGDLYTCNACKKRNDVSCSGYTYPAGSIRESTAMLSTIADTFKQGNKVKSVELVKEESYDNVGGWAAEREVYGQIRTRLKVIVTTATGRNERTMWLG